jgi:hypothetical protein
VGSLKESPASPQKDNFAPVGVLDKRPPSRQELLGGLLRQAPFVAKNSQLYVRNVWRRHIWCTNVVAP